MTNETQRIKYAQETFYKWCLSNLPVGRTPTQKEVDASDKVRGYNRQSRKHLFGHEDYVWYLRGI